jgi:hypothetical protein
MNSFVETFRSRAHVILLASLIDIAFIVFFAFGEIKISGKIGDGKTKVDFILRN